ALQESEQRLADVINFLPDATFAIDMDGKLIAWNQAMTEMSGIKAEDVLGKGDYEYALPFYGTRRPILCDMVLKPSDEIAEKYPFIERDGEGLAAEVLAPNFLREGGAYVWARARPLYNPSGQMVGVIESVRDITERKQAEEALAQAHTDETERQHALIDSILDNMPIGVIAVDNQFQVLRTNKVASQMLGREVTDREGNVYVEQYDVINVDTGERYEETDLPLIKAVTQGGRYRADNIAVRRPDGTLIPQLVNAGPLLDASGEQIGGVVLFADITERKQAEEAIRENEERLGLAMEASNAGVWEFWPQDDKFHKFRFNSRWFAMLGYKPNELPASYATWRDLLHPDDIEPTEAIVLAAVGSGGDFVTEFRMKSKDDDWHWIYDIGKTVEQTEDGTTKRMIGTHTDITERKQTEEAIKMSATQLSESQAVARLGNWVLDVVNNTMEWSAETHRRFDTDPAEFTPSVEYFAECIQLVDRERVVKALQESLENDVPYHIECWMKNETGREWVMETFAKVERDEAGKPLKMKGTAQDITARKQAEEELRRLSSAVEQAGDGIAIVDMEGNALFINQAWADMHGYTSEELVGKHLAMFHTEEQLANDVIPFNELVMKNGSNSGEVGHLRKDGSTFPTMMTSTIHRDNYGNPVGLIGTARDITEQKQTQQIIEDNLQQTQIRFEVSQALVGVETEEAVLDALLQQAGIYPNIRPSIFTVVPDADELTLVVRRQRVLEGKRPVLEEGMHLPISQFPTLRDSAKGKVLISSNLLEDENVDPSIREIARQTGALSSLSLPLMAGEEYLGIISVSSPEEGYFDGRKLYHYQALATQGATALQSARLRAEIQQAQERYRQMVESSPVGIVRTTPEGQLIEANSAILKMGGFDSIDENNKIGFINIYADRAQRQELFQILQAEGQVTGYEIDMRRQDGSIAPVATSARLVTDETGKPVFLESTLEDITERKQTEEELRQYRERLEEVVTDRTHQLEVVAALSNRLNAILEIEPLLAELVSQIQDNFDYYYTHIYLLDDKREKLVVVAGTGVAGQEMKSKKYNILLNAPTSLVARAARTSQVMQIDNVREAEDWRPNP
ncbi:MAG: PAS domain S-box protein, partial [Gammaproteobacteria bacterium]|nr:PAS domain S-box protein [Gammaproteobacteria bacterium]